jgi:serine/threonine protein kinase
LVPGVLYTNERERMEAILGTSDLKGWKDINHLLNFHPLNRAKHTTHSKRELVSRITKHSITKANPVYKVDKNGDPALYVVREGTVTIRYDDQRMGDVTMTAGAVFGHDILVDTTTSIGTRYHRTTGFSATGVGVIGILPVQDHESLLQIPESVPQDALRGHPRKGKESLNRGELELRSKIRHVVESDMDLADFERIKLLGEGMFGEVWLVAADIFKTGQVKQQFALKSQRKEDDTRGKDALSCIEREIKSMRDLNHAQLVHLVHTFEDEDNLYMLMNLIPGGELLDRIYVELVDGQWSSGLSEDDAKFYIYTIADTLDFIHSRKYIFRDLKPENIMLDSSGYPVLVDFGFAKYVEDKTYTFCGTPNYCAPEIILNAGHNRGVDHWALGVTLYEMVTGENPFFFEGMDTVTLYDAICREPPYLLKPEDGRSEQLIDLVGKLLEKNPSDRIGMLASGMQGILDHPWFDDLDTLRVLRKRWPAPWKPEEPEDKKTQAMMESSMTASFDGLAFMSMNDSHGSLSKMSFDDQPIAEDDGQHSSLGEMLDGSSRSFYSDPLHFSTDSFAHSSMREEGDTHHEEPRYDSDSSFHDQPIVCQDSLGVVTEKNVESSSRKAKKNEPSRQGRSSDAGAPKGAMGNINSIITSPSVAEFRKKKSAESKSRRSAISGALADLGIASDEDDIF